VAKLVHSVFKSVLDYVAAASSQQHTEVVEKADGPRRPRTFQALADPMAWLRAAGVVTGSTRRG